MKSTKFLIFLNDGTRIEKIWSIGKDDIKDVIARFHSIGVFDLADRFSFSNKDVWYPPHQIKKIKWYSYESPEVI